MAVAQILDNDLKYIDTRFIDDVTSKVCLGDGLEIKEDGKLYAVNADTQQIPKPKNWKQELKN